jgi:outer membrane protein assembly factor BamB
MQAAAGAQRQRARLAFPAFTGVALALCTACAHRAAPPVSTTPVSTSPLSPRIATGRGLFVTPNPYNALSSVVSFDARGLDSARVVYWSPGEPRRTTPFARARGTCRIAVLGLRPEAVYSYAVESVRAGRTTLSDTVRASSGELPEFLRSMQLRISGRPSGGYVLTSVADTGRTSFVVAFDSTGAVRWYREFPGVLPAGETKQQPNGDFTAFLGRTPGWMPFPGWYEEFRPSGEVVRTFMAPPPLFTDNHELILTFRDTVFEAAHFFSYSLRPMDLSRWGGPRDIPVAEHQLQRVLADGTVETVLDGWQHYTWADRIEPPRDTLWDVDHPNAITFDHDGNYIVSYRNMGEITKIDARTGRILWRFGGRNNQFTIRNDPLGGFSAQHSVRVLANGDILLYDNGTRHTPPETRAVEYRLDTGTMTADLVWQYRHSPPRYVPYTGSVQRLADGNTVIGYSNYGIVTEVDRQGRVVWEGTLMRSPDHHGDFYRAIKIVSLYRYEAP